MYYKGHYQESKDNQQNIFANYIFDKSLVSRIYEKLLQLNNKNPNNKNTNNKNTNNPIKNQ